MKKLLKKIANHLEDISLYFEKTLVLNKGNLFKGAVAAISLSLIALSQTMPFLYDKDLVSFEKKIKFEAQVKNSIERIDCDKPGNLQLDCKNIKHELKLLGDSSSLLDSIIKLGTQASALLLLLATVGFLLEMDKEINKNKSK